MYMEDDKPQGHRVVVRKSLNTTVPDIIAVRIEQLLLDKKIKHRQFLMEAIVRELYRNGYWDEDKWFGGTWEPTLREGIRPKK